MSWIEYSVSIDHEAVESVSALFAEVGYNGGVAVEQPFIGSPDGPEYTVDTDKPVVVRTYVPLDEHAEEARARLEQGLWALGMMRPVGELQAQRLEEEDWANAWKAHYPVQRIGERTVVVPSWLEYEPQPNDVVLHLDPGMAFGTGLHPTTRLCLQLLEHRTEPNMRTMDLGCGSGILAIAAAKLGAQPILALDNDPIAVTATIENVERNGVQHVVTTVEGSLGPGATLGHWLGSDWATKQRAATPSSGSVAFEPDKEFDLIVANILANVHVLLAPYLQRALTPGGLLVTSGIIDDREADVAEAFAAAGLEQIERLVEGEWIALVHQRMLD
jgi:ribosomal protein L11 methyltransferase